MSHPLQVKHLSLADLRQAWTGRVELVVGADHWSRVDAAQRCVRRVIEDGQTVYGINTGFGLLAKTRIEAAQLQQLQHNLVMSHAAGVGKPLPREVVRLCLVMKIASLTQGHSGISRPTIEALLALLKADALPVVPAQGSVGASGDLAPLAHLSAALLGLGQIDLGGTEMPAAQALRELGLSALQFGPKEGLALLNGTQVSTALALAGLFSLEQCFAAALCTGAMSIDAAQGSDGPFDSRIHVLRGQPGQLRVAAALRGVLAGSSIRSSHVNCDRVQDPYSLRCQPQVMGACLDLLDDAARRLLVEANAVTDNPLVFPDDQEILSGGNFHAEPVAFAADMLALAAAEIGNMSERRSAMLIDPALSGLPPFLVNNSGLNSGFMIAQVTAAALASENKQRAHPASVDTIPTSANQEDHVSMATHAARRVLAMTDNLTSIVAIEALCAGQGIEFHRPRASSPTVESLLATLRSEVPPYTEDRLLAPDIEAARRWVIGPHCRAAMAELLPSST